MTHVSRRLLEGLRCAVACCAGIVLVLMAETALARDAQAGRAAPSSSAFHSAAITRLAVDPDSRVLVSASEDKTVRIWDLPSGQLLRVITPPAGPGNLGKIHALAISPDGKTIACAGYTGKKNPRKAEYGTYYDWEIYLYELRSGRLLRTIVSAALVDNLVYSKSGAYLLASSSEMPRRVYDATHPWQAVQVFATSNYEHVKNAQFEYIEGIADFDAQGRLLVIGQPAGAYVADLFTADFDQTESRHMGLPSALSFAPDDATFAVAQSEPRVAIYSARDLSRLHQPDLSGIQPRDEDAPGDATIAWSMDGKFLYMADSTMCGAKGCWIRKWGDAGRGRAVDVIVSPHRVTHLVPLQSGGVVFATAGPAFGVLDIRDERSLYVENRRATGAANRGQRNKSQTATPAAARPQVAEQAPVPIESRLKPDSDEQKQLADMHAKVNQLTQSRRYAEALPIARQAVALVRLKLAPRDPGGIEPFLDLGRVLHGIGNYRTAARGSGFAVDEYWKAQTLFDAALTLKRKSAQQDDEEALRVLDDLADLKASAKKFDEAMDLKHSVLTGRQTTNGANHPAALKAANDLDALRVAKAIAPSYSKELIKALPLAQTNLRDAEARLGPQHPNVAVALTHLSQIYAASRAGFQQAAIVLLEQALALRKSVLGADHWDSVTSAMDLARLYEETGQYGPAERHLQQAVDAERKALGPDDPDVMKLVSKQAYMLRSMGKYREAATLWEEALAFRDRQLGQGESYGALLDLGEMRETLQALAGTYRLLGAYERSALLYQRLIATRDQGIVDMKDFKVAEALSGLGKVNRLRAKHGEAKARLQEALAVLEPDVRATGPKAVSLSESITVDILEELSALAVAEGDLRAARAWLMRAAPLDQKVHRTFMRPHATIELKSSVGDRYFDQLLWLVGRHFRTDTASVEDAFALVLNRKGMSVDLQSRARGLRASLSSKGQKKWDQLAHVRSELASLMLKGAEWISQGQYQEKFTLLFEQQAALEADVAAETQDYSASPSANISKQAITQRLPAGTALIEFVRIPDVDYGQQDLDAPFEQHAQYLAFVLTASGRLSLVDIGAADQVDALVAAIQSQMRGKEDPGRLRTALKAAHVALWRPLIASLGDADKIVIGPDSHLHELPFAALIDAKDEYLVQRYRFAYVGTARDLVSKPDELAQQTADLVLFADPAFDDQVALDVEARVDRGSPALREPFRPLPNTAEEARLIPPLVTGDRGKTVLLGKDANEAALKRTVRPRILHIATHGFYLPQQNFGSDVATYESALVSSGLALAGANHAGRIASAEQDDGLVTALEVMGMDLSGTQLVVLSACDTGAGTVTSGQGVIGLGRAFTLAGARSVLMSLWPVDDRATADLMTRFYRNLQTLPAAEALHRAELDLIRDKRTASGSAAPKLWAPFILQDAAGFAD